MKKKPLYSRKLNYAQGVKDDDYVKRVGVCRVYVCVKLAQEKVLELVTQVVMHGVT